MKRFEYNAPVPSGGHARASGGCYHLSFRSASRAHGSCARSAHDYITRTESYDDPDRDAAIYAESDHMPDWAHDDARGYWDAADLYERSNGRLYISADFALPRTLDVESQVELAHAFAQELTADERLPYTLAIHAGKADDGRDHNPHAHIMISERQNDGVPRTREQWFRRASREHPARGGAPKSRTFHGREWMEQARERWAALSNAALERAGRHERVDHRSYARQGVATEPGRHIGPAGAHMVARGIEHVGFSEAVLNADHRDAVQRLDRQIDTVEAALAEAANDRDPVITSPSRLHRSDSSRSR